MYDAIVIGGGVVGASLAYHLVRGGARTLLLDRTDAGRATDAGAGILTPELSEHTPDALFEMALAANDYYPQLVAQLAAEQDGDTGFARCGQLTVALDADELAPFAAAHGAELARPRSGASAAYAPHELATDEARRRFPALASVQQAMFYPRGARVDGRMLAEALRRAAEARGLEVRAQSVDRLLVREGAAEGVEAGGERIAAGAVAVAGGAWTPELAAPLGITLPIEPQRGQIAHLQLPGADTGEWPVVCGFRGHYIVAWPGGRVVAGATRERGSGFAAHTSVAGVQTVLAEALRLAPGLAAARLAEVRVGLRPASADGLPILGALPGLRGAYVATGHGPHGLQLGPYSGKLLAEIMLGAGDAGAIAAFGAGRFSA